MKTLQQLQNILLSGKVSVTQYALSTRLLGSAPIDALSATYLQDEQITLEHYEIKAPDEHARIIVTGTGTTLPFTGMRVEAMFQLQGDEVQLMLQASGADGWNLSQSFPDLQYSPLASVAFAPAPQLHLASYNVSNEIKQGRLFFAGTLRLTSILKNLGSLFGLQGPRLAGPIEIQYGLPNMALAATIQEPIDIGLSTRPTLTFEACSIPFRDDGDEIPDTLSFLRFRTELPLNVQGKDASLPLVATLYQPESDIVLSLDLERVSGTILTGLDELSSLAQGVDFAKHLPSLPNFHLADLVTLKNIFARVNPAASSKLVSLGASVQNARPWTLFEDQATGKAITLDGFTLGITVPLATPSLPSLAITGTIGLGAQGLFVLSLFAPDFTVVGGLAPGQSVKLREVIEYFIEEVGDSGIPALEITAFDFSAQVGKQYTLHADVQGDWPIPLDVVDLRLTEVKSLILYNQETGVQATLSGSLTLAGVDFTLTASNAGTAAAWTFTADAAKKQPIHLSRVIKDLLRDTSMPDEMSDLEFSDITIQFTPGTRVFSVKGTCTTKWELPFGVPNLTVSKVDLTLARLPGPGNGESGQLTCSLALHTQGTFPIVDGLVFESLDFTFALDQVKKDWILSGSVGGTLFDCPFMLGASLETSSTARIIKLLAESAQGIELDLGAGSTLTGNRLSILISKTLSPTVGDTGKAIQLNAASAYSWAVSATGALTVAGVDELTGGGTLTLSKQDRRVELVFEPTRATATFSLPEPLPDWTIGLGLKYLSLARTSEDNGQASWSINTAITARLNGLPAKLLAVIPTNSVDAQLKIDKQGATVSVVPLVAHKEIEWSTSALGNLPALDLGTAVIAVPRLDLQLGKNFSLSGEFGIGIPEKMNALFGTNEDGTPKLHFFNTYEKGNEASLTRFTLGLDSSSGLQLQIRTSPLQAIHFIQDRQGNPLYTADLGEFGYLEFSLPTFSYNGGTFRSSHASFKQGKDPKTGEPRPLKIPLTPFKLLFEACKLDELAKKLPAGLPLQDIQIYRKGQLNNSGAFDSAAFDNLLKSISDPSALTKLNELIKQLTGSTLTLGEIIAGGLHEAGNLLDQLPDSLIDYLHIEIPKEFSFDLNFTESGSLQCSVSANPAIKILYPTISPLGPQLNGLTLRSFSLGELFDGALLPLALDMDLHQFPLLPLAAALLKPLDGLPRPQDLTNHLAIHNLFMVIITETGIPLPVPLFFDQLGIEYHGIENLNFQVHGAFPNPLKNLGLSDFVKLLKALGKFITDSDYLLDATTLPHLLPVFTLGPNTIQLPPYLGGRTLVDPTDPRYNLTLDANESVPHLLNFLKTLNLNEIIQSIPLENRVGQQHISFGSLEMDADWLVTRPSELQTLTPEQKVVARLTASEIEILLQLLPAIQAQMLAADLSTFVSSGKQVQAQNAADQERGLVIFLKGNWQIASTASLMAYFGLVNANSGFGTSMRVAGNVTDLIALDLSGLVSIHTQVRPGTSVVSLQGKSVLSILNQQVLTGSLSLEDKRFAIAGTLHLPFGWTGIFGSVDLSGHLSDTALALSGSASIDVGTFTLAGAVLAITHTGLTVTGTWLKQSMVFSAHKVNDLLLFQAELALLTVSNVITITGSSPQGGPAATLGLKEGSIPYVSLDGTIELPLIQSRGAGLFRIIREGFTFGITGKLFGSNFGAAMSVTGTDIQNAATFIIGASMDNNLVQYLEQSTTTFLDNQLQTVNRQLEPLRQQIQLGEQNVINAKSGLEVANAQFQQKIAGAQQDVANQSQAVQLTRQALNRSGIDLITKYFLEKELDTYEKALQEAERALQGVRDNAIRDILKPAEDVLSFAQQGLEAAQQGLLSFEQFHKAEVDALQYIANYTLSGLLIINSASFTAQYRAISDGRVSMNVNLTYTGRTLPQQIDFDFYHPDVAVQSLANKLLPLG
ncbi:hypothetical protein KSD_73410 [Ktedonobacter sp. SOSP1-85]|uniref:hypothetical protein n=1 Tax=Ktedonobacter sp. SOSP1-85 TaxID=2778367 RepID=UPI001915F302|nr:hypothetical protein [Ktedonobacter sp. SOSP1-85]GHO79570.1 hypothetical protein KSD_73410 [Ktedonobacter sp. SOSP1-85]